MCRWSPRTGWSWSPGASEQMVNVEESGQRLCRSVLFTALLATEAFVRKGDRCCYTNTKDLLRTSVTDHRPGLLCSWPFLGLHTKAKPRIVSLLCHGVLRTAYPAPSCNTSGCALKRRNWKGWENLRVIGTPTPHLAYDRDRVL